MGQIHSLWPGGWKSTEKFLALVIKQKRCASSVSAAERILCVCLMDLHQIMAGSAWKLYFLCSQAISRPSRSLSTAQLVHTSCGSQASVISNIVLMKGQGKVRLALLTYHTWCFASFLNCKLTSGTQVASCRLPVHSRIQKRCRSYELRHILLELVE